jgi:hypothetical protein
MIINIRNQDTWRTMTALQESIKFYNDNNQTGKYNSALLKEQKMLQSYRDEIKQASLADKLGSIAA